MLNFFPDGILSGAEKRCYPSRDVSPFLELYTISTQIYDHCLLTKSQPGWAVAGKQIQKAMIVSGNVRERKMTAKSDVMQVEERQ